MPKPNILILMVDQLNGTLFPDGPADWLHAPNLKRLAARSTALPMPIPHRRFARRGGRASCRGFALAQPGL
jgi:nicotinamidase-related amidase